MAIAYDQDVQLRLSTRVDGADDVSVLDKTVEDLQKDLQATAEASKQAAEAQTQAATRLKDAKLKYGELGLSLRAAQNEYRFLNQRAKESGAGQEIFAAQASAAKTRVQSYRDELVLTRNNLRVFGNDHRNAAAEVRALAAEQRRLAQSLRDIKPAADQAGNGVQSLGLKLSELQKAMLTYLGVTNFGPMIRSVADTADAYQNLSARIRLVTGDGEAFDTALAGVERVAAQTNSALESTADLFTRVYKAGRELNISQQEALALTQTINQAIQVSGASAQSADAATVQLIQGLQSGVLRGEEFNSVMEQSPRLAQAMADGLSVSLGKLREMANAGQLTSQVVIRALQSQGRVVEDEYSKMPETIGRAMTQMRNAWTMYVGEVDKNNGVSQKAAEVIGLLSRNLDTVAASALAAGKAWLAYRAWNIADEFLLISKSAQTAALAKKQDAAATVASTVATASNTAATATNTAATAANSMAQTANAEARARAAAAAVLASRSSAAAATNITSMAGKLAGVMSLLKGFSFAALLTNLPEIGTWIGETIARMQGYGKAMENAEIRAKGYAEAARQAAQQDAEIAAKRKAAAEASLGLNDASRKLIESYDAAVKGGKSATEAAGELAKALRLEDLTGISNAGAALDALAARGTLTAQQVQQTWAQALSGRDLQTFLVTAQAAFDGTEQGARRLAAATEGALSEALRRTGKDMAELTTGVGAAARAAINDTDVLAEHLAQLQATGVDVGVALSASLDKALAAANTDKAVAEVIERLKLLGAQGKITGEQLRDGLDKAQRKLEELKPGINSLAEAFRQLGMKSTEELQHTANLSKQAFDTIRNSGQATTTQIAEAFRKYAEDAIAANGGVATEALKVQAAMSGVKIEVDAAGRASAKLAEDFHGAADASERLNHSMRNRPSGGGPSPQGQGGGLSGSGKQPDNLSVEQMQNAGWSQHQIEDYQLNRKPDQQVPGRVNRQVSTDTASHEQVARNAGLRGDDVKRFAEVYGDILNDKMADFFERNSNRSVWTADSYRDAFAGAMQEAINEAKTQARKSPAKESTSKETTIKIQLAGRETQVRVADDDSAQNLIRAFEQLQKVAA